MPCSVDRNTQEILKLAQAADPTGDRTMGILTKPDLATENKTKTDIIRMVQGEDSILKLGYHIIKNRSADDDVSTAADRLAAEEVFFATPPWPSIADRCGVKFLRPKLGELLMRISKQEFPHVKLDIERRLLDCKANLKAMGPARTDQASQRLYLVNLASRFQTITKDALNAYYAGDNVLKTKPALKLATRIVMLNEVFSDVFWKKGHKQHFKQKRDAQGESPWGRNTDEMPFEVPLTKYPELGDIITTENYECPEPVQGPILSHIREVFQANRGLELGTVRSCCFSCDNNFTNGSILVWWDNTRHRFRGTIREVAAPRCVAHQ